MSEFVSKHEVIEQIHRLKTEMLPPFLGMDSFHLLAWMHEGPAPEDRDRPADVLILEVWRSALTAAAEVVEKS